MAKDEFLMKMQNARKAVEAFDRERMGEPYPHSENPNVRKIQKDSGTLEPEAKTGCAADTVCPYCGGKGTV